ncbi:MoaD/ThiS family protein [Botrimarina sp.]|uniref:MoaD/ThiS family protein n=1 Tax=Botrimarina sp. TaxID=2795802 RepID=UPI0032EC8DE1
MNVEVLLFGPQAAMVGARRLRVEVDSDHPTAEQVCQALSRHAPALRASLSSSRLAVNQSFAGPGQRVGPDDEVALIGMVSGG